MKHRKQIDVRCTGADMSDGTSQVTVTIGNLTHDEAIVVGNALQGVVASTIAAAIDRMSGVESATVIPDRNTGTIQ